MHGGVSRREFAGAGGVRANDQNIYYTVFSLSLSFHESPGGRFYKSKWESFKR
jgi:hypothetical protein